MTKLKIVLTSVTLLLCIKTTQAQWETSFSQFWTAKSYYNPSFAGEIDKIQVAGIYKYQWTGIENSPKHIFLSTDMPIELLGMRHGVGILTYNNSIGNERNNILAIQYTFKQKIGKGMLNIGLQAGRFELNFDAASAHLTADSTKNNHKTIKANPTDKKGIALNAGVSWTTKNYYIGAAVMHINQPKFYSMNNPTSSGSTTNDSTLSKIPISYNFIGGCNIHAFHPLFEIQPMVLVLTDLTDTRLQTALRMVYNKKYSAGASWNGKRGYSFFAGAVIQEIEFGYAYDLHTSGIGKESKGSHEISIKYRFPIDLFRKKPMPHKSIRLL
ncbi:MAG: PorP/SprF family type IX secretion system membrane protein [Bacteroidia bacterium]|nr:PorP/SprF family type IX secretion system membrane protein [Bacteroidia bacterium]